MLSTGGVFPSFEVKSHVKARVEVQAVLQAKDSHLSVKHNIYIAVKDSTLRESPSSRLQTVTAIKQLGFKKEAEKITMEN